MRVKFLIMILGATVVVIGGCEKVDDHSAFLGKLSEPEARQEVETGPLSTPVAQSGVARDRIVVTATEWDQTANEIRSCRAELRALKQETEQVRAASFVEGERACMERTKKETSDLSERLFREAELVIEELQDALMQYRFRHVVVNGECHALMNDGSKVDFILRNVCLNVVNKKVGNDGAMTGILGAVSAEATRHGIVSIDCDVGRAHLAFISKSCSDTTVSGADAGRMQRN